MQNQNSQHFPCHSWTYTQSRAVKSLRDLMHQFSAEAEQENIALLFEVSYRKRAFVSVHLVLQISHLCVIFWFHCLKGAPCVVLKFSCVAFLSARRLQCASLRKYGLDKLCSGMHDIGCEFNVNISSIYVI